MELDVEKESWLSSRIHSRRVKGGRSIEISSPDRGGRVAGVCLVERSEASVALTLARSQVSLVAQQGRGIDE